MIIDSRTNKVYLAQGLLHYMPAYLNLLKALTTEGINNAFLPLTESVKHIWARDYMPIQLEQNRFLQYRYQPDYLKGYEDYIPNYDFICKKLKLNCIKTNIILDGGNVIKCGNKVIMTDKIFPENFHKEKTVLINDLEELFQAELVLIPWDRYEMYGHADGMVRYIRGNIVLLNNYVDFDNNLRQHLLEILSAHFIVEELEYELPLSSKMSWAYLNFLQTEKCIFVPGLSCKEDQKAVEQIQQLYPQQKVILIEGCRDIVKDGGALNCISWNILEDTSDKTKTITNPLAL